MGNSIASGLKPMYRMPVSFGPSAGPRNVPADAPGQDVPGYHETIAVSALTDAEALRPMLAEGCELDGEPVVTVRYTRMANLGWLAGRAYNIVRVTFPIRFHDEGEELSGSFMPVLWESLADPITTGREELGHPKLWAEIPDAVLSEDGARAATTASWLGFRFFEIEAWDLRDAPPVVPAGPLRTVTAKYMPRTGAWGESDVEYLTYGSVYPPDKFTESRRGTGRFAFHPARWEDMPTQFHVVTQLAELPLHEFRSGSWVVSSAGTKPVGLHHKIAR